jgi:hypothetical protein
MATAAAGFILRENLQYCNCILSFKYTTFGAEIYPRIYRR